MHFRGPKGTWDQTLRWSIMTILANSLAALTAF